MSSVTEGCESALQAISSYSYNQRGQQTAVTDAEGNTTRYVYDNAGRLERLCDATIPAANCGAGSYTSRYGYDLLGRRIANWDAAGNLTSYTYDSMGRLLSVSNPHPETAGATVFAAESHHYNLYGQRDYSLDALNRRTNYTYDAFGRLSSVSNPAGEVVSYGYDELGRVLSITNGNGKSTRFEYDVLGQMSRKIWPDGAYEDYRYDAGGNLERQYLAQAAGVSNEDSFNLFSYDSMGRLLSEAYEDGQDYHYSYNALGLLTHVRAGTSATGDLLALYTYDSLGRPEAVSHYLENDENQSIHYAYDLNGNRTEMLTKLSAAPQSLTTYGYDALNRPIWVSDRDLSAPADDELAQTTSFAYNSLGLLSTIARPNGINTSYTYGSAQNPYWLTAIQHRDLGNSNALVSGYAYTYDNVGNRLSMTETTAAGTSFGYNYSYDAANRLVSETIQGTSPAIRSYTYDRAGNRLTSTYLNETDHYAYNANDQLTRLTYDSLMFDDFAYDAAGNLVHQQGISGISDYTYNSRNQLTNVSGGISYSYDHAGRRVEQNISGSETHYLWDEYSIYGDVVLESNAYNQYERHYTLANGMLISQNDSGGSLYFLADAQNSTRALTDESGAISSSYKYDAFGKLDGNGSLAETKYLYTAQQYDPLTELYSLRARYYDPSNGRFLSRDTWAYDYQNPIELNRYVYTSNNPTMYTDPSGNMVDISAHLGKILSKAMPALHYVGSKFLEGAVASGIGYGIGLVIAGLGWAAAGLKQYRGNDNFSSYLGRYLEKTLWTNSALLSGGLTMLSGGISNLVEPPISTLAKTLITSPKFLPWVTTLVSLVVSSVFEWWGCFASSLIAFIDESGPGGAGTKALIQELFSDGIIAFLAAAAAGGISTALAGLDNKISFGLMKFPIRPLVIGFVQGLSYGIFNMVDDLVTPPELW